MNSKLAIHGGKAVMEPPVLKYNIGIDEANAVKNVINESGVLSSFRGGKYVKEFEDQFAKYIGTKYAIATTSGTTALHASLAALNLKKGSEVLVPAVTFVSTASVVLQEHLIPVFVDIDEYFCMQPDDLLRKITNKSKAIIPVHLYGQPADMNKINKIAKKYNLSIIEDACQSHGAKYSTKHTGNLADVGCFSFFQSKNMTCGEGGMITTSNEELYKSILLKREHGSPRGSSTWYGYNTLGFNYNMTELQAAVGLVQLKKLDLMNKARSYNAKLYEKYLSDCGILLPKANVNATHVWHNYTCLLPKELAKDRDFFVEALKREGIPVDIAYPTVLYKTNLFIDTFGDSICPNAEDYTSRLFTLFTDISIDEAIINNTRIAIKKILNYLYAK